MTSTPTSPQHAFTHTQKPMKTRTRRTCPCERMCRSLACPPQCPMLRRWGQKRLLFPFLALMCNACYASEHCLSCAMLAMRVSIAFLVQCLVLGLPSGAQSPTNIRQEQSMEVCVFGLAQAVLLSGLTPDHTLFLCQSVSVIQGWSSTITLLFCC